MPIINLVLIAGILFSGAWGSCRTVYAQGEAPQVLNAKLDVRTAGANFEATMKETARAAHNPAWIGYEVAGVRGKRGDCCGDYGERRKGQSGGVWHLEKENGNGGSDTHVNTDLKLEGGGALRILYRADKGQIERIRMISSQCQLDAGGLPLVWLKDVKAAESVAFLSEFVLARENSDGEEHQIGEQALTAIALHADASADKALERFGSPDQPEELRKRASFWMGAVRGEAGLTQLETMAKKDPSSDVRAQVSFALFVSKEPGAMGEMARMAREDGSPHVRGQALFWLAQKAGAKAEDAIAGAIMNDPDTEVKKKAVFALTQMPKDEGVPRLIEVAEKSKNPEVRKQAMFWLGQSGDPRALAFFERVLSN